MAIAVAISAASWFAFSGRKPHRTREIATHANGPVEAKPGEHVLDASPAAILTAARSLTQSAHLETSSTLLSNLRTELNRMGGDAAAVAIRKFLGTGANASTGLGFKLSGQGRLKEAPTLRVFLLDYLAEVNPKAAASCAEEVLRSSTSPDEWAVSLRAYALGDTGRNGTVYLQTKTRELLRNESWRETPSVGFLEAFDVVVYTHDRELTAELAGWVRQTENRALAHAAYLTLDRLIQAEPVQLLEQLQSHPDLLTSREATRADFFARADVRDARQRQLLENYLLDLQRSPSELEQFAATYPNANFMVSNNLLTENRTPGGDELAARDREALRVTEGWLNDPKFARLGPQLQTITNRLQQFVNRATQQSK